MLASLFRDLAVGLGLWIFIEGVLVAAMPVLSRRLAAGFLAAMERIDPWVVRIIALLLAAAGLCVVWLVRG